MRWKICIAGFFFLASIGLPQLTITNGSFDGNYDGWTAYQCTATYQAGINSSLDPLTGSGSALITADAVQVYGSFYQDIGINAEGQTVTIYADVAWDGDWDYLFFGFYEADPIYDIVAAASVSIAHPDGADVYVEPDTDGTLDNFTRIEASGTLPTSGNDIFVWMGSACSPYVGGPKTLGSSSFAIDNISSEAGATPTPPATPTPTPFGMTNVSQYWEMYE